MGSPKDPGRASPPLLPDGAVAVVIGDVVGHDLHAAAAMASTRNMLRAFLFHLRTPPSAVLAQLDRTLEAITDNPVTTTSLARIEPAGPAWRLHWSTAGHVPPLLITPGGRAEYLSAGPGLPLSWASWSRWGRKLTVRASPLVQKACSGQGPHRHLPNRTTV